MVSFLLACAFAISLVLGIDCLTEMRLRAQIATQKADAVREARNTVLLTDYDPVTDTWYANGGQLDPTLFEEIGCDELALVEETERELDALGWR